MKYWEIIADNFCASGWTWGCASQIDSAGRVLFTADAHRDNGKRFIVTADEKLTAFLELERVTHDDGNRNQTAPLGLESFRGARRRACFSGERTGNQLC